MQAVSCSAYTYLWNPGSDVFGVLPLCPPPPLLPLSPTAQSLGSVQFPLMMPLLCRCGNVAAILELDEHLTRNFKVGYDACTRLLIPTSSGDV